MAQRKWPAFTLVEILVIVAMTGIMAAILYPIFGSARDKTRQSSCMNNQRQLVMAMNQYAQDHNSTFPGVVGFVDDGSRWHDAVRDAHYSDALFACPSAMVDGSLAHPSYGMNGYLYGVFLPELTDPAHTLLSADANTSIIVSGSEVDLARHGGSYVASFMDGQVKTLTPEQDKLICHDGVEGNALVYGATSIRIDFTDDTKAIGNSKQVDEGTTVCLVNQADEAVTPKLSVNPVGAHTRPGLNPETSDLHLATGKSKVFTLFCSADAVTMQRVETLFDFGDAQHLVEITVRPSAVPMVNLNNMPSLTNPPGPPMAQIPSPWAPIPSPGMSQPAPFSPSPPSK